MRVGYVIVGVVLVPFAALAFLTVVLWPLGAFLAICAGILFYIAPREPAVAMVIPLHSRTVADDWVHPNSRMAPPPALPLPVVLPSGGSQPAYQLPSADAYRAAFLWCPRCQRSQPPGTTRCLTCGAAL